MKMRLHEEYIARHAISIPVVNYDPRSVVILKHHNKPCSWNIVDLKWVSGGSHPGWFSCSVVTPQHNLGESFRAVIEPRNKYWEDYERTVLSIVNEHRPDFRAIPRNEIELTIWEIFLFAFDTRLSNISENFTNLAYRSTFGELDSRKKYLVDAKNLLHRMCDELYHRYVYEFLPLEGYHADWLERLFNV